MAEHGARDTEAKAADVAAYVATMTQELKSMAERHQLTALAYLLELARMEAEARAAEGGRFAGRPDH
ncbi:MAG: hypothetical protein IT539_10920 [Bradyrhizobiaceae bacterium]|nr:hypothetical protein [Bradyrhizobiaceae bacterium]